MNALVKISKYGDRFQWTRLCDACGAPAAESLTRPVCAHCGGSRMVDVLKVLTLKKAG